LAEFLEFGDGAFRVQSAHAASAWRGLIVFQNNSRGSESTAPRPAPAEFSWSPRESRINAQKSLTC
jgi:hypothetical protein